MSNDSLAVEAQNLRWPGVARKPRLSRAAPVLRILPGLVLAATVAAAAYGLRAAPALAAFSPMIVAIAVGVAVKNLVGVSEIARPGLAFAMRWVLRSAIVLLGLQLTFSQVSAVGAAGVALIAGALVATFLFTTWLGAAIGVDRRLTQLIAAGTSICGASAVMATNTVTRGGDEDVAYAVACVTLFGSIAMFAYPALQPLLHLDPRAYGLWTGASVHEVAQVVAAGFEAGREAGEFATVSKLTRVMMLAPVVIALGAFAVRRGGQGAAKAPKPLFVLGFAAMVALNSAVEIPAEAKAFVASTATLMLTLALAAMGLETDFSKLRAKGARPLLLGAAAFVFIACVSLALVKLAG